jgi:hypothetical protein
MRATVATTALLLFNALLGVQAHKEPKTPEEIETQRGLQAAAYYVRKTIVTPSA